MQHDCCDGEEGCHHHVGGGKGHGRVKCQQLQNVPTCLLHPTVLDTSGPARALASRLVSR